jgi:acetyltransferase-like isoleucine patch superfamily enzyme
MEDGVTLTWPESVIFSADTVIGRDAIIEPHVVFGPGVTVETGARIRAFSHLEGCHVSSGAVVGPYARLRPDAEIGNDARIGNFVEVKAATIGEGTKVNHLSYIGDADLGAGTNVGAGTVTCNYDGVMKHRTVIGRDVFIGSDTMLVAPVTVGDEAMTASGSVITEDVPEGALAVGRARQVNKPGLARRLMERLRAIKKERRARPMCGIVGVLTDHEAAPILVEALKRLEYRGYDSAGIATVNDGVLDRRRAVGKLHNLSDKLVYEPLPGKAGIGHTRWATHGGPTVKQRASPSRRPRRAVVHNGIIENYRALKECSAAATSKATPTPKPSRICASPISNAGMSPREAAARR